MATDAKQKTRQYITKDELKELFPFLTDSAIYTLSSRGTLPKTKFGRHLLFDIVKINQMLDSGGLTQSCKNGGRK